MPGSEQRSGPRRARPCLRCPTQVRAGQQQGMTGASSWKGTDCKRVDTGGVRAPSVCAYKESRSLVRATGMKVSQTQACLPELCPARSPRLLQKEMSWLLSAASLLTHLRSYTSVFPSEATEAPGARQLLRQPAGCPTGSSLCEGQQHLCQSQSLAAGPAPCPPSLWTGTLPGRKGTPCCRCPIYSQH